MDKALWALGKFIKENIFPYKPPAVAGKETREPIEDTFPLSEGTAAGAGVSTVRRPGVATRTKPESWIECFYRIESKELAI